MAWRWPDDKPLYEPLMVSLLTHSYVTRPQWVKWKLVCFSDGFKYWTASGEEETEPPPSNRWSYRGTPSTSIEMTGYAMLATLEHDNGIVNSLPISKWLTSKQNRFGGYTSTQVGSQGWVSYELVCLKWCINTLRPPLSRRPFQMHFLECKYRNFSTNLTEIFYEGSN